MPVVVSPLRNAAQEPVTFLASELCHQRPEVHLRDLRQLRTDFGRRFDKARRNVELLQKPLQGRGQFLESWRNWWLPRVSPPLISGRRVGSSPPVSDIAFSQAR